MVILFLRLLEVDGPERQIGRTRDDRAPFVRQTQVAAWFGVAQPNVSRWERYWQSGAWADLLSLKSAEVLTSEVRTRIIQVFVYNIPREVLEANHIGPQDVQSDAYRAWVKSRVQLAREYFEAGRDYLARVQNPRCRLAGFAYTARFEWLLDTIEREGYSLRPHYSEQGVS